MKRIAILLVVAAFALLVEVGYAYSDKEIEALKLVVQICEERVQIKFPFGKFSAYVKKNGMINFFGTDAESFEFEKCMSEHDSELSSEPPKKRR